MFNSDTYYEYYNYVRSHEQLSLDIQILLDKRFI
jgi:hypothetical protein